MKREELIGREFKWISTLTGGETFGIIEKVIDKNFSAKITSTKGNIYYLKECSVKLDNEFKSLKIED
jgi:hypothetical protein